MYEARRNPELNPKVSAYQRIKQRYEKEGDDLYVSFTAIDKLGINPTSRYDTPIGIYAYPASYVLKTVHPDHENMNRLPFAGNQPYVNIFSSKVNIIDVNKMSLSEMRTYTEKLKEVYLKLDKSGNDWKTKVDIIEEIFLRAEKNARFSDSPSGQFWYISMNIARLLQKSRPNMWRSIFKPQEIKKQFGKNANYENMDSITKSIVDQDDDGIFNSQKARLGVNTSVMWNKIFRMIGIDGFRDNGVGIIHTSEPHQAVFFSKNAISNVERVHNKWSASSKHKGERKGNLIKSIKQINSGKINTLEKMRIMIDRIGIDNAIEAGIDLKNKLVQMAIVLKNSNFIEWIEKEVGLSEEAQIIAVKQNSVLNMKQIADAGITPSEEVQLAAVENDAKSLYRIINALEPNVPSEKVQLAAIKNDAYSSIALLIIYEIELSQKVIDAAGPHYHEALKKIKK